MKIVHSVAFFRSSQSGYESERAGTSQGIFFLNFIELLVKAHYAAFRGFELWIHHDDRVKGFEVFKLLERYARAGLLKLIDMGPSKKLCESMLWRLNPLWDESVDVVVCRDVDSLPMDRDRKMIEEFIESKAEVHAILDSESHTGPLMGGMTAFKAKPFREKFPKPFDAELYGPCELERHGGDQRFLNAYIWPRVATKTFIHQRHNEVQYPEALVTKRVAPQETALDRVVRHIGAAYPREAAEAILDGERIYELGSGVRPLQMLKELRWPQQAKATDEAKPWYTPGAVEFLDKLIDSSWRVLEFGGGASSEWYLKKDCSVKTVESDPLWVEMIESRAKDVGIVPERDQWLPRNIDLLAVDGVDRIRVIKDHWFRIDQGGYLLLDNSETLPEAGEILKGWERHDFKHPEKPWTTSIFHKP